MKNKEKIKAEECKTKVTKKIGTQDKGRAKIKNS